MSDADADPTDPAENSDDEESHEGADLAAFRGAELVSYWDDPGGWTSLLRDPGGRMAAAGYEFAARALGSDPANSPLSPDDLATNEDGQFVGERLGEFESAMIAAELCVTSNLVETLTLALEVAFETGVKVAISEHAR